MRSWPAWRKLEARSPPTRACSRCRNWGDPDLTLLDVTPKQLLSIGGEEIPPSFRRQLQRYRYGPGVFKVDWALSQPIPWRARECLRAGTVHLGGTFDEIAASERAPASRNDERPPLCPALPTDAF